MLKYSLAIMLFSSLSFAEKYQVLCTSNQSNNLVDMELIMIDNTVVQTLTFFDHVSYLPEAKSLNADGSKTYSILIDDSMDTKTDYEFDIKNNQIVNKKRYISGNDSDNYSGSLIAEGEQAFKCVYKKL